jgi:hypothetical protein
MALKVKKQYKNQDGTITEVEGTEAEIESFEKKRDKKNESAQKKKEILHGKKAKNVDMEELKRFLSEEVQKLAAIREVHHWYFNNGWWWRPWYYNGSVTYLYSQTQPTVGYTGDTRQYSTATNAADLSKQIGLSADVVNSRSTYTVTNNSNQWVYSGLNNVTLTAATNGTNSAFYTMDSAPSNDVSKDVASVLNSYSMSVN